MRCDEVIRKFGLASDGRDDQALARHLAECKDCAHWAERTAKFDQLWDATRPAEPAPEAWDRVWSSVSARLDEADATVLGAGGKPYRVSAFSRSWRGFAVVGVIGLAQAAAILLAMSLSWTGPARKAPVLVPPGPEALAEAVVDVPEGEVLYIRSDKSDLKVIDITALEAANGEDPWFIFFDRMESANMIIAME